MALLFEPARPEHAKAILEMRNASAQDLVKRLGPGHWGGNSRIQSIRERIELGNPAALRPKTLFVATREGEAVGSLAVNTWPPGFWKRSLWQDPKAIGAGVFDLVVFPHLQGQGIGRFLMEGVEAKAQEADIEWVRLDAYADNPLSNGFYQALGYEDRGRIDVHGVELVLYEKKVL